MAGIEKGGLAARFEHVDARLQEADLRLVAERPGRPDHGAERDDADTAHRGHRLAIAFGGRMHDLDFRRRVDIVRRRLPAAAVFRDSDPVVLVYVPPLAELA